LNKEEFSPGILKQYGNWTVLKDFGTRGKYYVRYILAKCKCGKEKEIQLAHLRNGASTQCIGCAGKNNKHALKHGLISSPEYITWLAMKQRCYDSKRHNYKHYGERGIIICERWLNSFENFYADMGPRPSPKHSIDRINNDGNYEPVNCRWATQKEQVNNTRNIKKRRKNNEFQIRSGLNFKHVSSRVVKLEA
jgi:hypothetical protein